MNISISLDELTTIVTALVAVIGLCLSIYNFYVDRRDKTPRLAVKLSGGMLARGPTTSPYMTLLEAANTGEKMVKITAVEILWRKQRLFFPRGITGTRTIPLELQPGDNVMFWSPPDELASDLRRNGGIGEEPIRACFRTAIGREFVSKQISLSIDEWANPSQSARSTSP